VPQRCGRRAASGALVRALNLRALLALLAASGCAASAGRQDEGSPGGERFAEELRTLDARCPPENRGDTVPEDLRRRAESGPVAAIVRLNVTGSPDPENASYLRSVRSAQQAVVTELRGTKFREVRRFEFVPLIALEVSRPALDRLGASTLVVCVVPDSLSAPTASSLPRPSPRAATVPAVVDIRTKGDVRMSRAKPCRLAPS